MKNERDVIKLQEWVPNLKGNKPERFSSSLSFRTDVGDIELQFESVRE